MCDMASFPVACGYFNKINNINNINTHSKQGVCNARAQQQELHIKPVQRPLHDVYHQHIGAMTWDGDTHTHMSATACSSEDKRVECQPRGRIEEQLQRPLRHHTSMPISFTVPPGAPPQVSQVNQDESDSLHTIRLSPSKKREVCGGGGGAPGAEYHAMSPPQHPMGPSACSDDDTLVVSLDFLSVEVPQQAPQHVRQHSLLQQHQPPQLLHTLPTHSPHANFQHSSTHAHHPQHPRMQASCYQQWSAPIHAHGGHVPMGSGLIKTPPMQHHILAHNTLAHSAHPHHTHATSHNAHAHENCRENHLSSDVGGGGRSNNGGSSGQRQEGGGWEAGGVGWGEVESDSFGINYGAVMQGHDERTTVMLKNVPNKYSKVNRVLSHVVYERRQEVN